MIGLAVLGGLALWSYAFYAHPEARGLLLFTMVINILILLSPILIIRPVNEREHRDLQVWGKDYLERQSAESDEEAA